MRSLRPTSLTATASPWWVISFLLIRGKLQNLDGVISVKADHVQPLEVTRAATASHDFH